MSRPKKNKEVVDFDDVFEVKKCAHDIHLKNIGFEFLGLLDSGRFALLWCPDCFEYIITEFERMNI